MAECIDIDVNVSDNACDVMIQFHMDDGSIKLAIFEIELAHKFLHHLADTLGKEIV